MNERNALTPKNNNLVDFFSFPVWVASARRSFYSWGGRKNNKKARREEATVWQMKLFPAVAVWRYTVY